MLPSSAEPVDPSKSTWWRLLPYFSFVLLGLFLFLSNDFDWDHFLSAAEVDLRSWLLDFEPPVWSYQFCSGAPRAGDPQAFGLSPLFLPVILFGSYWGLKILTLICAWMGYLSLYGIARRVFTSVRGRNPDHEQVVTLSLASLSFVFCNYFLWHLHHGHITFSLIFLVLVLTYFFLEARVRPLSRWEMLGVVLCSWSYFSGGFYHSLIFFALPLTFSVVILSVINLVRGHRPQGSLKSFMGPTLLGFALAFYKIRAVIEHQKHFPRTLEKITESMSPVDMFIFQFLPTWDYKTIPLSLTLSPWGIWEYSSFHLLGWFIVFGLIAIVRSRSSLLRMRAHCSNPEVLFWLLAIVILGLVGVSASTGDSNALSLHHWMNMWLKGSIRVIGRYQILFVSCFFILFVMGLGVSRTFDRHMSGRLIRGIWIFLLWVNLGSFSTLSLKGFLDTLSSLHWGGTEKMQHLVIVPPRDLQRSHMYRAILAGAAVPNCYNPIRRDMRIIQEFVGRKEFLVRNSDGTSFLAEKRVFPWLGFLESEKISERCMAESYFTQNRLHISKECPPSTCLNLNGLNPSDPVSANLGWDDQKLRFCLNSPKKP